MQITPASFTPRFGMLNSDLIDQYRAYSGNVADPMDSADELERRQSSDLSRLRDDLHKRQKLQQVSKLVSPEGFIAYRAKYPALTEGEVARRLIGTVVSCLREFTRTMTELLQAPDDAKANPNEQGQDKFQKEFGVFLSNLSRSSVLGTPLNYGELSDAIAQAINAYKENGEPFHSAQQLMIKDYEAQKGQTQKGQPRFGALAPVLADEYEVLSGRRPAIFSLVQLESARQKARTQLEEHLDNFGSHGLWLIADQVTPTLFETFRQKHPKLTEAEVAAGITRRLVNGLEQLADELGEALQSPDSDRKDKAKEIFNGAFGAFLAKLSQSRVFGDSDQSSPLSRPINRILATYKIHSNP